MESKYDPKTTEARWYAQWRDAKYFKPESAPSPNGTYTITIPPPNVTGSLHMGHAVCYTIQDALGRWQRQLGKKVLILPGVDHAGIATQNVVEKEIAQEGLTRHDLGREKFLERVWIWKKRFGERIISQMQGLGCAFDWDRERFTMDDDYVDAILEEFVRMFDAGMIYRGARVINWCPRCATALSDIEVEYVERDSHLWHIRYDFADGNGSVTVATTRPETMLGDTAVAVNPDDPRYAGMAGRELLLPLTDRRIPLIFDSYASMEFGTGAVKVTPAHDLNDYEAGKRHGLPMMVVIGESGKMTAEAGDKYAGLTREECREAVVEDLEASGNLVQIEDYKHSVGTCERCHTIIEPLLSEQWFARMAGTTMIANAIAAIESEEIKFVPDRYKRISVDWLENIKDWCISRQLWWGHRIPIYYAHDGKFTAAKTREGAAARLGVSPESLRQDDDVLDTWFSSALWPFATLGWPNDTEDLREFYPTNVLTTAREILFLWVARMIMTGIEFTGQKPFDDVYIYATVLDKQGRRMSKSLGNGIDPLEMIDKYGADALRFSLMRLASKGQDIRFSEDRIPEARNFCTKIWNAARFVNMNLDDGLDITQRVGANEAYTVPERAILSKLQATVATVSSSLASYDLDVACEALRGFFWDDYCDVFVEWSKSVQRGDDAAAKARVQLVLWHVLETFLRLAHPFMPYLTEEIWHALPHDGDTVMYTLWPTVNEALVDPAAEEGLNAPQRYLREIRAAHQELGVPIQEQQLLQINEDVDAASVSSILKAFDPRLALANVGQEQIEGGATGFWLPVSANVQMFLPDSASIDLAGLQTKIKKQIAATEKSLASVQGKLNNPNFISKASEEAVTKSRADEAANLNELEKQQRQLAAVAARLG
ncbi:MAG TPA: valine--tRNA ligase [Capsulimonadaceae bacterium]|jgi:valyl-tRNA synthetase